MKHLLLLAGLSATILLGATPTSSSAQAAQMGATVDSGLVCPTSTVLAAGVGRYVYQSSFGALCISGIVTSSPYTLSSTGYQQVAITTVQTLVPPALSKICYIQTETNAARYRTDGVAPTATVGFPLPVGAQLVLTASLTTVQFVSQTGTTNLSVDCYK